MPLDPGLTGLARPLTRSVAACADRKPARPPFRALGLHNEVLVANAARRKLAKPAEPDRARSVLVRRVDLTV